MEDEYLLLNIDVFDVAGNQAKVRKSLTINGLIEEILREFDDLDRKTPAAYAMYLKGNLKPLERDKTVAQLDLQTRDELEFRYARRSRRDPTGVTRRAYLWEEKTRKIFELTWQPALIGRPDADPAHNELLAANLETFADGLRVSRRHAQITVDDGEFYIESLSDTNPTYVNDVPITERYKLQSGDKIRVGKTHIILTFAQE